MRDVAPLPIWRSMLFVPCHVDKYVNAAHRRGADAYILDLEDSVPMALKQAARTKLAAAVPAVRQSGAAALVRINADVEHRVADLDAAVQAGVAALMIPKVDTAETLRTIAHAMAAREAERGLVAGQIRLIAQIEDVHALARIDEIASATPRLMGMILGSEDFSLSAGMAPVTATLMAPNQQLVFACRRAGILPFGFPGSISVFRDLPAFRDTIQLARQMGFVGAYAIHPDQVMVMNEGFRPSDDEVEAARQLLAAAATAEAQGRGAFEFRGLMVDAPVISRAREVLRRVGG